MTTSNLRDIAWRDLALGAIFLIAGVASWQVQNFYDRAEKQDAMIMNIQLNLEKIRSSILVVQGDQERLASVGEERKKAESESINIIRDDIKTLKQDLSYIKARVGYK